MKEVKLRLTDQAESLLHSILLTAYSDFKRKGYEGRAAITDNLLNQVLNKVILYEN